MAEKRRGYVGDTIKMKDKPWNVLISAQKRPYTVNKENGMQRKIVITMADMDVATNPIFYCIAYDGTKLKLDVKDIKRYVKKDGELKRGENGKPIYFVHTTVECEVIEKWPEPLKK